MSKGDEIMPAIKTLKLLAHGESDRPDSSSQRSRLLMHTSSLDTHKNSNEKCLIHSKSLRMLASRSNAEESDANQVQSPQQQDDNTEQQITAVKDGDS